MENVMEEESKIAFKGEKMMDLLEHLNLLLASYQIHYQKVRGCHWNVKGRNFFTLHMKFEELYLNAQTAIDDIAERLLTLGKSPLSTLQDYLAQSEIKEINTEGLSEEELVGSILHDFGYLMQIERDIVTNASEFAGDEGTADMMIGFLRFQEKTSWMLNSWIGK